MTKLLIIGLGGFFGANCRYLIGGWVAKVLDSSFPYGTMVVNITGSFIIGLFLTLITDRFTAPPSLRLFFAIGFLGAYTTFSTFAFESFSLISERTYMAALTNLFGSVLLGLAAVAMGIVVGRAI